MRLNPADTTRVARALEVVLSTGKTLAQWQNEREGGIGSEVLLKPLSCFRPGIGSTAAAIIASPG